MSYNVYSYVENVCAHCLTSYPPYAVAETFGTSHHQRSYHICDDALSGDAHRQRSCHALYLCENTCLRRRNVFSCAYSCPGHCVKFDEIDAFFWIVCDPFCLLFLPPPPLLLPPPLLHVYWILNGTSVLISAHHFAVSLGRYHSASILTSENGNGASQTEEETVDQILKKENSAAGIFCWLKANAQTSNLALAKDAVGVVATLGRVDSDDLSRILSEYLGLQTMLAIVCNTSEGVNALEKYDPEGTINCNGGLHGIGSSIGRRINGRFVVICLEDLRPYVGGFAANDPQKKLAIPKPGFPNEECPPGFLDYAVNMIHLDSKNLSFVTASGHGLRETLFYALFSRLQVYKTRNEMMLALPFIVEGAVSLDGGMIKKNGMFALGSRKDVEVKFPLICGESDVPPNYSQAEDVVKRLKWESSKLAEDIKREQQLLDNLKRNCNV